MANKKSDTTVHMRMDHPISNRKDILATTIDVIALMQRYHRIKEIRAEKERELASFRTAMKSLYRLSTLVKLKDMPVHIKGVRQNKPVTQSKKVSKPIVEKPKKVVKKHLTEAESLDEQLDLLRRKLESL